MNLAKYTYSRWPESGPYMYALARKWASQRPGDAILTRSVDMGEIGSTELRANIIIRSGYSEGSTEMGLKTRGDVPPRIARNRFQRKIQIRVHGSK